MATQKLKIKKSSLAKLSPGDIATILRYNKMLANRTGQVIRAGDVVRVPKNTLTTNTMTTNSGVVGGTSGGILAGGTGSGYGTKGQGTGGKKAPKPKKVTPILKVNKPNPKPKPKPKKPTPLKPAVAPVQSPIRPQSVPQYALPPRQVTAAPRQFSPLGGGGYTYGVPYTPVTRPYATTQAQNASNAFNWTTQQQAANRAAATMAAQQFTTGLQRTFDQRNMSPLGGGGYTLGQPLPQPAGTAQRQQNPVTLNPSQMPTVTQPPLLQPDNTQAPYVVDLDGNVIPGSDITLWYLEQGLRPLVVTPYHQNLIGVTDEEMAMAGYVQDDWGNWIRSDETSGTPVAGGGGGGTSKPASGYSRGGGGGWGGTGGGYGYSPSGRQTVFGSEMGAVTWRI